MPDNVSPIDDPPADHHARPHEPRREEESDVRAAAPASRRAARQARAHTGPTAAHPAITRPPAEPLAAPPAAPQHAREHHRPTSTQTRPTPAQTRPAAEHPRLSSPPQQTARAGAPAATGTLDELFTGRRSIDDVGSVPPPSERRRRRVGGWVAFAIVVAVIGGIVAAGLWAVNSFGSQLQGLFASDEREDFEPGIAQGEATITIDNGDAGLQVSEKLFEAGVTKASHSFYDYLIETSTVFTFQPGVFRMQQQMTSEAVLIALRDPQSQLHNGAVLPEGFTSEDILVRLSEQMGIPLEEFRAAAADPAAYGVAAPSLEGWLFPATYDFPPGTTPTDVITTLVARTVQSLDAKGVPVADRQRVLTVASIIEREARLPDDFYKVSRVIENRLAQGMKLQMDSTAQYGSGELREGSASTSDGAQFADNAWNTYVVPGLPVGPISSPGDRAIDAALHPAEGDWLYFVTVNLDSGETTFSATLAEHEAGIEQMRSWCREHPDSGC